MSGETEFVHLHVHTEYSLLDGACRIKRLAARSAELGMPACAMTDHGTMFGTVKFCETMKSAGVKPIVGYEAYVAPGSRLNKESSGGKQILNHLTLLAMNETGYQSLLHLSSMAYLEGFYYKPRIDWELLDEHADGLIALSGCLASYLNRSLLADNEAAAIKHLQHMKELFGPERFYVELQDHGLEEQKEVLPKAVELARKLDIPVVATNDTHFISAEDKEWHEILLCINTGKTLQDADRFKLESDQLYFKSGAEMAELFGHIPDALSNTLRIAEMCNLELNMERRYPSFIHDGPEPNNILLRKLCEDGLRKRYDEISQEAATRLDEELTIIQDMGYVDYFLIVWDFVRFAREQGIPVGMRGSGGGSLVSHALGLTDISPLKYDLLFSRFLDPERREPPDIDIDLCEAQREKVIDYVRHKYGQSSVAQIITFGTLQPRNCVRDVGRVMGIEPKDINRLAKLIPDKLHITLKEALEESPELNQRYKNEPRVTQLIDYAINMEGLPRHASTHAAGVVIADRDLWEFLPLYRNADGLTMTQFEMSDLEEIGMLKMDFLGLRTLTIMDRTLKLIEQSGRKAPDLDTSALDLEDKKTYALLRSGKTAGVFQFGSVGMQQLLKRLKPSVIEDLIAVVALYRPGPMKGGVVDDFVERKHGRQKTDYPHPVFEPILAPTYGMIIYQEQIMRIANEIAGLSMASALTMIKAVSKKKGKVIEKYHVEFTKGAVERGLTERKAEEIFALIQHFSEYGFNKAHTAAYGFVAYRTAFLKAHYPTEFMAATISCEMGNSAKVVSYMQECRAMRIEVLPPDINESQPDFSVVGARKIRFGLAAIKNVGTKATEVVLAEREKNGPFKDMFDLCERIDPTAVTKSVVEHLVKAGCCDDLPGHRAQQLECVESAVRMAARRRKNRLSGQLAMFGGSEDESGADTEIQLPNVPELSEMELASQEKAALGLFVRHNPLKRFEKNINELSSVKTDSLDQLSDGDTVVIGGIITKSDRKRTRAGKVYYELELQDLVGVADCVAFEEEMHKYGEFLTQDKIVFVTGQISLRQGVSVRVQEVVSVKDAKKKFAKSVCLAVSSADIRSDIWTVLKELLAQHPGDAPVYLEIRSGRLKIRSKVAGCGNVKIGDSLREAVEHVLGPGHMSYGFENNGVNGRGGMRSNGR